MKFPLQTISTTIPGWLMLTSTGQVECIPSSPDGPLDLGPKLTCTHGPTAGCRCELDLPGDPELRLDLTGAAAGVRPSAALHVRGEGRFDDIDGRTIFGRRRLEGIAVSPLCDDCLDGRKTPRFAVGLVSETEWPSVLRPVCQEHAEGRDWLLIEEADARCGIDIVLASPSHALVRALLADHRARYPDPPFPIKRRYATDLEVGAQGRIFAEHIRVDADGRLWLATWARVVAGMPGVDVPIRRLEDGTLRLDLSDVRLKRPIRPLVAGDPERGFVVDVRTVGQPTPPPGQEAYALPDVSANKAPEA